MAQYRPRAEYTSPARMPRLKVDLFDYMITGSSHFIHFPFLSSFLRSLHSSSAFPHLCYCSIFLGFHRDLVHLFPKGKMSAHQANVALEFGAALTKLSKEFFAEEPEEAVEPVNDEVSQAPQRGFLQHSEHAIKFVPASSNAVDVNQAE